MANVIRVSILGYIVLYQGWGRVKSEKRIAFVELFLEKDWCFNSFSLGTEGFLDKILLFFSYYICDLNRADSEIQKEGTGRLSWS